MYFLSHNSVKLNVRPVARNIRDIRESIRKATAPVKLFDFDVFIVTHLDSPYTDEDIATGPDLLKHEKF